MTGVGGAARSGLCEIDFDWLPSKGQSGWTMLVIKTGTRTDLHILCLRTACKSLVVVKGVHRVARPSQLEYGSFPHLSPLLGL